MRQKWKEGWQTSSMDMKITPLAEVLDDIIVPSIVTIIDPVTFTNCSKSVSEEGLKTLKMEIIRACKLLQDDNDFLKVLENPVPFPQG